MIELRYGNIATLERILRFFYSSVDHTIGTFFRQAEGERRDFSAVWLISNVTLSGTNVFLHTFNPWSLLLALNFKNLIFLFICRSYNPHFLSRGGGRETWFLCCVIDIECNPIGYKRISPHLLSLVSPSRVAFLISFYI